MKYEKMELIRPRRHDRTRLGTLIPDSSKGQISNRLSSPCSKAPHSIGLLITSEKKINNMATNTSVNSEATETSPLVLGTSGTEEEETLALLLKPGTQSKNVEEDVPMPRLQIYILCFVRMVEPVAYFSIFPYLNQMILETGNVAEEDVGFYSGWIVSYTKISLEVNKKIVLRGWDRSQCFL